MIHLDDSSDVDWQPMPVDRFAAFHTALGIKVRLENGIWWRQVRPFFYRPLLPLNEYSFAEQRQGLGKLSVFQHAVKEGDPHNSFLNPIVFDRPLDYQVKDLGENARRKLKKAISNGVTVSRVIDPIYFAEHAYPVYLSFYGRTKYTFDTSRRNRTGFSGWARNVFAFPENVVLGAFASGKLIGLEITCLVENTLIIETVIHSDEALKLGVPDLMLHHWRSWAAKRPQIRRIFDSMLTYNEGINEFKFRRGATALALPAVLHIHPVIFQLLKSCNKSVYQKMHGLADSKLPTFKRALAPDMRTPRSA